MAFQELTCPSAPVGDPADHLLDEKLCPSPPGQIANRRLPTAVHLADFAALPDEQRVEVLPTLDLHTLAVLRLAYPSTADAVDALPSLATLTAHAPHVLAAVHAIGTARWTTPRALDAALRSPACEDCGDAAGYLHLLAGRRVCRPCLGHDARYLPLTPDFAARCYGLDLEEVEDLPQMLAVGGVYGPGEQVVEAGERLVDRYAARRAGIEKHGGLYEMERFVETWQGKFRRVLGLAAGSEEWEALCPPGALAPRRPDAADPVNEWAETPLRYVAVVRVPWVKGEGEEEQVVWPVHCLHCQGAQEYPFDGRRQFTRETFADHFRESVQIRDGTHILSDGSDWWRAL